MLARFPERSRVLANNSGSKGRLGLARSRDRAKTRDAQHVRATRMLGSAYALELGQLSVRINFVEEALEECLSGRGCKRLAIVPAVSDSGADFPPHAHF